MRKNDKFGTVLSTTDLVRATVVDEAQDNYLVEVDGEHAMVEKDSRTKLILETDALDDGGFDFEWYFTIHEGGQPIRVEFSANTTNDEYTIKANEGYVGLDGDRILEALELFEDGVPDVDPDQHPSVGNFRSRAGVPPEAVSEWDTYESTELSDGTFYQNPDTGETHYEPTDDEGQSDDEEQSDDTDSDTDTKTIELGDNEYTYTISTDLFPEETSDAQTGGASFSEEETGPSEEDRADLIAERLYDLYHRVIETQVRTDIVSAVMEDRYDTESLVEHDGGVIIGESFYVNSEGENYTVDDYDGTVLAVNDDTGVDTTGDTVDNEGADQFLDLDFEIKDEAFVTIDDSVFELTLAEQKFLATVEVLQNPEQHLGNELSSKVNGVIDGSKAQIVDEIASTASVEKMKSPRSGLVHYHGVDKHTLTATFNVSRQAVDELFYEEYDHAGLRELLFRRQELVSRDDVCVFLDTDDADEDRWAEIADVWNTARVPPHVMSTLEELYPAGSVPQTSTDLIE